MALKSGVSVSQRLADWAFGLTGDDLRTDVRSAIGRHLLDGVGVALAARRSAQAVPALTVAMGMGGPEEARILGSATRIGTVAATFGTGALVHALDFDDTHAGGLVHATAIVLPVALSVGQQVGASGEEVMVAAAIGFETLCRIATGSPHGFHARGLHATSVVGPLAAAAVAAKLMSLTVDETVQAIGIAGSSSAGLLEFLQTGSSTKALHPGSATAAGVMAARLAAAGATGPSTVIEGRYGLYATMSARPSDPDSVLEGLGSRWETTRITIKPYPACQLLHATLDALAILDVPAAQVQLVCAQVPADAIDVICEPREAKVHPRTPYEAKFSLPWSAAALLIDGQIGVETYSPESIARPAVAELAGRVQVQVVPSTGPAADAAGSVRVTTLDGRTLRGAVTCSSGGPRNPMSDTALEAKFSRNAGGSAERSARIRELITGLAGQPDLTALFDLLEDVR